MSSRVILTWFEAGIRGLFFHCPPQLLMLEPRLWAEQEETQCQSEGQGSSVSLRSWQGRRVATFASCSIVSELSSGRLKM